MSWTRWRGRTPSEAERKTASGGLLWHPQPSWDKCPHLIQGAPAAGEPGGRSCSRETGKQAYENKPKTNDFSVRRKKKQKKTERLLYFTHTQISPWIQQYHCICYCVYMLWSFFVLVPGLQSNMTCNTIGRRTQQQVQKPATRDYQYL